MRNLFTSLGKITVFLLSIITATNSSAQSPTYLLKVANESSPSPTTYEFEVFLLNTSSTPFELQSFQFGLGFDTTILMGGTQSYSIVNIVDGNPLLPAPSELNPSQVPTAFPAGGVVYSNSAYPGVNYRYFNCAAKVPPGAGNGTIISMVDGGCTHPGTRVARFRITNTVPFRENSTCKHIWSTSAGSNRTNTIIQAYIGGIAANITAAANNINYDKPGSCIVQPNGLLLNLTTCPTANGGGPYSTCSNAIQLSGAVGGPATAGTWSSPTGGSFSPSANTLNAVYHLTATDISNGGVTLTLTSNNPDSSCVAATSQATVVVTSTDDGNACTVDGCNTTNGTITHTPLPGIDDGNAGTVDACNTSTGVITHTGPAYLLKVANESQPDPNTYEFEVFLLSTGTSPLELQTFQFGLGFDTTILMSGTQSYSIVTVVDGNPLLPAPSELNPIQVPTTLPAGGVVYTVAAYPGVNYRYFNLAARTPPGSGNGTIISSVDGGCTHPGTRVARFRITNTVPFRQNSTCKHIWSTAAGANRTSTIIQAYPAGGGGAINITSYASDINYDKPGSCIIQPNGLILNPATCPTSNAGGPYNTCSNAVQLNGAVGGGATGGTWSSPTGGAFSPNASALNAIYNLTATDISNGGVTLTLTSDNPDSALCVAATSQAVVVATSTDDGNACTVDACNTANGTITHTPVPIDDGNPATVDACNTATGVITHNGMAYQLRVANESQPGPNTYEFEVYLLSTGAAPLELQTFQFGLGFDTTILMGGTQSYSIVTVVDGNPLLPAPSELVPLQVPTALPLGGVVYTTASYPGVNYRYFNCATRTPPGAGNGTIISTVDGGCTHPGTRVARFRITNTVPFRTNSTCKHIWSTAAGANRTSTIIQAYPAGGGGAINITSYASDINYDKPGSCIIQPYGLILNPGVVCPTANAGGPYTTCANVVQLNGAVGGGATAGTWSSPTGGTFSPNANALNAIYNLTATDISNGGVILTLTSDNPDSSCIAAVSQATVVVAGPIDDGNVCTFDACNSSNGNITHTSVADDGNACTVDFCDGSTGNVTHTPVNTDDGNACTVDNCNSSTGVSHTPIPGIDDGNPGTVDACNSTTGVITHTGITYELRVANESQPSPTTYEFEVYLLSTGSTPFELQTFQFGLGFDTTILMGGTQSYSIVNIVDGNPLLPAPSELVPSQVPTAVPAGGVVSTNASYPGVSYRYFNCAAKTPPGAGNGTIISSVDGGCTHPGTRVARFRITNTVPFRTNSTCKHIWSQTTGPNRTNTIIQAYPPGGGGAINITFQPSDINYDKPGSCIIQPYGLILNPPICPTANAGGPYSTCGNDVQLNGSVGGSATSGTWSSPTGGSFSPNANALNATYNLTAADISNGGVTLTLTSDNPEPLCQPAVSFATVTAYSIVDDNNPCTIDGCDPMSGAYHSNVPDGSPGSSDNNVCTSDVCDSGITVHNPIPIVDDGNVCTVDGCDPVNGEYHTNVADGTPGANDNNVCTSDVCDSGITVHNPLPIVDDNNPCTVDGCNPLTGPTHTPDMNFIPSDGNGCTSDYCDSSGIAQHDPLPGIDDANLCTVDHCDPLTGIITHTLLPQVNDGDPCTIDGCNPLTGSISHTPNSPIATAVVSTPITCYGGSACITVSATGGVAPYDSSSVGVFCGYSAGPPPVTFDVTDAAGCTVTTSPLLVTQPSKVTVTASSVCTGSTGTATAIATGGTGSYTYLWTPGGQVTNPATGLANGSYAVTVTDGSGCTATSPAFNVNCSGAACNAPGPISGPGGACRGQTGVVYCITPVVDAVSYNWTLPMGATAIGSAHGSCITLNFSNSFNGGSLAVKTVCASGMSANGIPKNIPNLSVRPSTPGSISGNASLCPSNCSTYSVASVSLATSYVWSVTGGLTITAGQGTNTVTVCAPSGFTNGALTVYAKNCKGNSGTRTKNITGKPALPAWQNGYGVNVTVGACAGSTIPYEVSSISGVSVFVWTAPAGAIIYDRKGHSGNPLTTTGTDPIDHDWKVDIKFPAGFVSGNVTVTGQNACGNGPTATLAVRSKPATPGSITGNSTVCKHTNYIKCYSISPVPGATSYTWNVSNGATIYSGQGSTNACVKFRYATSSSVTITVKANNSCGSSPTASKTVAVNNCKTAADGITEISEDALTSLNAYPNPTTDKVTITFNSERQVKYSMKVVDVIGRVLINEDISALEGFNMKEINLANVAKGLYLVSIQTEGGEAQTLRLVVE